MVKATRSAAKLLVLLLACAPAWAQEGAALDEALEQDVSAAEEAPAPAPAPVRRRRRAARPDNEAGGGHSDALKQRLTDISRAHKLQVSHGAAEFELWKDFWTKMRDERGLFEMRLAKQRDGFVESLKSLDPKDHGQALLDFENMQGNVMRAFEENQGKRIREFTAEREAKLREFGESQEADRQRMAQASGQAWEDAKSSLNIQMAAAPPPLEEEQPVRKKKKKRE